MKSYKWPAVLGQNATIGVVTLGAPDAGDNLDNFNRGVEWLKSHGFDVKIGNSALKNNGFLADTPEELISDLNGFLLDPDITFIMISGGGANCNRLLNKLDFDLFTKAEKGLMGLSNPTVLLNALTTRSGVISFHGPAVVWNLGGDEPLDSYSEHHMLQCLRQNLPFEIEPENTWNWMRQGSCNGHLLGGNLWSLQQLLGTSWEPDWENSILFIEDCFTQIHQIDATLMHFEHAGVFSKINGMVIGIFEECNEEDYLCSSTIEEIVMDIIQHYSFPVLSGVHLGHTSRKVTIPIGATALLDSTNNSFIIK